MALNTGRHPVVAVAVAPGPYPTESSRAYAEAVDSDAYSLPYMSI